MPTTTRNRAHTGRYLSARRYNDRVGRAVRRGPLCSRTAPPPRKTLATARDAAAKSDPVLRLRAAEIRLSSHGL